MSECIICKGDMKKLESKGFDIKKVDLFLSRGAFWIGTQDDYIWTFDYLKKDIDTIITDAQAQMQSGIPFEDTHIFKILSILIDNHISFAMWYDAYVDDLDICKSKKEVLDACYNQILDKSGMCEVYIVSNI